jgi:Mn-dependent DtxR family transcriptional regulator
MRKKSPPPSKSSERLREYLEIIDDFTNQKGAANHYDIFKRTPNSTYTNYIINYLTESGLVVGCDSEGYRLTEKGKELLGILKTRRELVGIMTQELKGDRIKPYS